jgi:signal transduction histidine kinase
VTLFSRLWLPLALLFAAAVLVLGAGEYRTLQRALRSEIDHNLQRRANWIAGELEAGRTPEGLMVPHNEPLEELAKLFVEIRDSRGKLVAASANLGGFQIPVPGSHHGPYATVQTREGSRLRVYQTTAGVPSRVILVAESLELAERSLQNSGLRVLALALLVAGLSAVLLRLLLHRSLLPLEQLADVARQIVQSGDTSIRARAPGATVETAQVADALNALLDRVDQLLQAQQQLLQDTSHELRNPLTVLSMDLDLLARADLDESSRHEVAGEARGELTRLVRLVEDLLLLSWAESRPALQLETIELGAFVPGLLERYRSVAPERSFHFVGKNQCVRGDSLRLDQILRNLLDNAVRYTTPGGKISVWIAEGEQAPGNAPPVPSDMVVLVVQDDGCGIAPEHWPSLFERFYRVESDRNRARGGTGLGLPLARALARAMGGDLWVYSQPGLGSSFMLSLPGAHRGALIKSSSNS